MVENYKNISFFLFPKPEDMISLRSILLGLALVLLLMPCGLLKAQAPQDESSEAVTLKSQYEELQRRTRIYEGFRAIREDMFQEIRKQSLDSLNQARQQAKSLKDELQQAENQVSLQAEQLAVAHEERDQALAERNSISLLGKPINKGLYNVMLWSVIGVLALLALVMLWMARSARQMSRQRAADLNEVLEEYETYRKSSRERLEKITIDHFNEIKKLKGL